MADLANASVKTQQIFGRHCFSGPDDCGEDVSYALGWYWRECGYSVDNYDHTGEGNRKVFREFFEMGWHDRDGEDKIYP